MNVAQFTAAAADLSVDQQTRLVYVIRSQMGPAGHALADALEAQESEPSTPQETAGQ